MRNDLKIDAREMSKRGPNFLQKDKTGWVGQKNREFPQSS
jgi:hypothetical protein